MFTDTKYSRVYFSIVDNAKTRPVDGYIERHHIIPRCLGGSNKKDNIVSLTAREHYVCHLLLTRMTEGEAKKKMVYAAWTMARTRKIKTNSRTYARLKEEATANLRKLQSGVKRGPMSEEHKQKIREASIRRYQDPDERQKASQMSSGRQHTEESKAKMRKAKEGYVPKPTYGMAGKSHSPETLEKMRLAWERRRQS